MADEAKSVLVVDDVIPNIKLLAAILHSRDYVVYEATNGRDALDLALEKKPSIVILDVMMPGMDGFEVCRRLKSDPRTSESSVIYVSAKSAAEDKIRGLELGAVDYIAKPFQKTEVLARVETHMALQTAKLRLQESERRYSLLFESAQDGLFLWAPDGEPLFANKAFRKMAGAGPEDSLKLDQFVAPEDLERVTQELAATLEGDGAQREFSLTLIPAGGRKSALQTSCLAAKLSISGRQAALVTVRDMTERLLLERHLQQTQKMEAISLLSSGIAHDFNNVLALMNGYAELALLELGPDSPVSEKLRNIVAAGKNAVSLTRSLLSFTRGKGMDLEPLDLGSELERIHGVLSHGLPQNIEFSFEKPEEKLNVSADSALLQQAVVSLCLNARDAMPAGGQLKISVSKARLKSPLSQSEGDYAVISVADSGSGIPEEIKAKIFDPFFTTKASGKASGLGLPIANRITRNHKGWLDFESSLGKGSSFRIHLPLCEAKRDARTQDQSAAPRAYKHRLRQELNEILLVAADDAEQAITRYFLEKEGYKVLAANGKDEAGKILSIASAAIKLMIVDRSSLNSEFSVEKLKAKCPEMKFLLMAGSGPLPSANAPILKKPFSAKDLLQTIDRV